MKHTLENVITKNKNGLFLLDPPTGFGKSSAVLQIIKRFLEEDEIFKDVKRIFFITNLHTNLPLSDLKEILSSEDYAKCFYARANVDTVIDKLLEASISNKEITSSKEYKALVEDIKILKFTKEQKDKAKFERENYAFVCKNISRIHQRISKETEPAFRKYIKINYFHNKSVVDKQKFIRENGWLRLIYPIIDIEKYKVVFLTTKKFMLPFDTFQRMPFYIYNDDISKDSLLFIDEFDSTKKTILEQIIDDGLKSRLDILKLFLGVHFALQNFKIPQKLLQTSEYNKSKVESGQWYTSKDNIDYIRGKFADKYDKYKFDYMLKTKNFEYPKAFLFDDGNCFNIFKDNFKGMIYTKLNEGDAVNNIIAGKANDVIEVNGMIRDIEYLLGDFTKILFYVSNNYLYHVNEGKTREDTKFTFEEALFSVLELLNLSDEEKNYFYRKVADGKLSFNSKNGIDNYRKGFNYTEIEDSNYHDMKSVIHSYYFDNTPEDVIIVMTKQSLVVGISATAKSKTTIGNYDLKYIKTKLGDTYIDISENDQGRINNAFKEMKSEFSDKTNIHVEIIDEFQSFTLRRKCEERINLLFNNDVTKSKYLSKLEHSANRLHHFLIELNLAYLYCQVGTKDIYSFISFLNTHPKEGGSIELTNLAELFADVEAENNFSPICTEVLDASNFDERIKHVHELCLQGKKVFVMTTYQTVGTGKNIQYKIPEMLSNMTLKAKDDTRNTKDFDGIYISTPTHLMQVLQYNSDNKYSDLARYIFQQEYLCKNKTISYWQAKRNIINGFRKVFFNQDEITYSQNSDMYEHTMQIAVQAIGRICRCRNKNVNTYIYADKELIERIQFVFDKDENKMYNDEFLAIAELVANDQTNVSQVEVYSKQSKSTYMQITQLSWHLKNNAPNISKWKRLREFVLKNPTANFVPDEFKDFYFDFETNCNGYTYYYGKNFDICNIKMDIRNSGLQVSEQSCYLPTILSFNFIKEFFKDSKYARKFESAKYIMNPSLYKQIYLGAIGEVVGKAIIKYYTGYELEELNDIAIFESFDYKLGNLFFDFKNWSSFVVDNNKYVKKLDGKLNKAKGELCFVINLFKQGDAKTHENIGDTVVQIPYLIDVENETINEEAIDYVLEKLNASMVKQR